MTDERLAERALRHRRIVRALEAAQPAAVVAATGRDPGLAGGLWPFPLLEDGDVDIPSVNLPEAEGERLASFAGEEVRLESHARRVPSWGCNVVATRGPGRSRRVIVCAHVEAKLCTAGALDDAAGVGTLLLLAELLCEHGSDDREIAVEFLAMNGEDHYANPGERAYFADHEGRLGDVVLAINLDGVGYREGRDTYSTYGCGAALVWSLPARCRLRCAMAGTRASSARVSPTYAGTGSPIDGPRVSRWKGCSTRRRSIVVGDRPRLTTGARRCVDSP